MGPRYSKEKRWKENSTYSGGCDALLQSGQESYDTDLCKWDCGQYIRTCDATEIKTSRKPLTSEYIILSKRALTSSDKAGGAGGAAGVVSKGEPALDGGASSLGDDAAGTGPSGIAISAMRRR